MHFPMILPISSLAGAMKDKRPHHLSGLASLSLSAPSFPNTFILPQSHRLTQALEARQGLTLLFNLLIDVMSPSCHHT